MSPSAVRPVIAASPAGSALADLAPARGASGRGSGVAPQRGTDSPADAGTDFPVVSTGTTAATPAPAPAPTPAPVTFGQTLAASMSTSPVNPQRNPTAPARNTVRKPAPAHLSPEMILASLPGATPPAAVADPAPTNTARANTVLPDSSESTAAVAPASTPTSSPAAPAGTPASAAAASALQNFFPTLSDEPASDTSDTSPPEPETAAPIAATSDSAVAPSDSGTAIAAVAQLTPTPAAAALTSDKTASAGTSATPDTGTGASTPAETLRPGESAHSRIEAPNGAAPGASSAAEGVQAPAPAAASLTTAAPSAGAVPMTLSSPSATASAAQVPAPQTVQVQAQVGSSTWAHELGMRLHLLAQQGVSSASLRLTPAQLGPVEVKISMHENAASVWFGASQADTRSALELSLPKLRELFASQGLNLTHAGVSDQSARGARREPQAAAVPAGAVTRGANATQITVSQPTRQGLIDTYA